MQQLQLPKNATHLLNPIFFFFFTGGATRHDDANGCIIPVGILIMNNTLNILYTLVLSLWTGGISIFTFLITPVIFKSFERDMAGKIVDALFPGYFLYVLALSVLALIILVAGKHNITASWFKLSLALIIIAVIMNAYVAFKLHPDMKQVKQENRSFEGLSPDSPLRKKFGKLHAVSATLNLLILADGVTLLIISSRLRGQL